VYLTIVHLNLSHHIKKLEIANDWSSPIKSPRVLKISKVPQDGARKAHLPQRTFIYLNRRHIFWPSSEDTLMKSKNTTYYIRFAEKYFGVYLAELKDDVERTDVFLVDKIARVVPIMY